MIGLNFVSLFEKRSKLYRGTWGIGPRCLNLPTTVSTLVIATITKY